MSKVVSGVVKEGLIVPEATLPEGCRVDVVVPAGVAAGAPAEPVIHDRGRGPEVRGTRITVYSILDYLIAGWPAPRIAALFRISSQEVQAAVAYIEEHRAEVMANYARILRAPSEATRRNCNPASMSGTSASRPLWPAFTRWRNPTRSSAGSRSPS